MNNQRMDDIGRPFEPSMPEEFEAQAETAFQQWWDDLDPAGTCDQVELDYTTAQRVWLTAYEYQSAAIGLVYDSAAVHGGGHSTVAELHLGYVVDRFHCGSVAIPTRAFVDWLADHEDDFCNYIDESEQVHFRIKSRSDEPLTEESGRSASQIPHSTPEAVRESEGERFRDWWERLDPPSSHEGRILDLDATRVVWLAACVQVWETLEFIHDSARAHADVRSMTADHELAYIVDKHHDGKLSVDLNDLMDWSEQHEQSIRRSRDEDAISVWIEKPEC